MAGCDPQDGRPPAPGERLATAFYARPVVEVARDLIGCTLVYQGARGLIVETEAYHQKEPACHAFNGPTPRAQTLFAAPGTAYVYFSYGVHALLNAVAEPEGVGAAVLIRALQPVAGVQAMRERRKRDRETELCSGPGKLTQALGVGLGLNGSSLVDGPIGVFARPVGESAPLLKTSTRVGITKATELEWRFSQAENPHLSR